MIEPEHETEDMIEQMRERLDRLLTQRRAHANSLRDYRRTGEQNIPIDLIGLHPSFGDNEIRRLLLGLNAMLDITPRSRH